MAQTCTTKQSPSQWNEFVRTCLEGTIAHLEFSIEIQSNNLTYHKPYSKKQEILHNLIVYLDEVEGLGYRKISYKLNSWGIKTPRGKKCYNTSVHSILKRRNQRNDRIENQRNKKYPIKIGKFSITYGLLT